MDSLKIDEEGRVVLPQPDEIAQREREDAMGAYLMMFGSWAIGLPVPLFSIIAAVVYFALNRKKSRFVAFHAYQAMITDSVVSALNTAIVVWIIVDMVTINSLSYPLTLALVFAGIWNLVFIVFSIRGAARAYKGRMYYFPFFGRLCFDRYYGDRARMLDSVATEPVVRNEPPRGY